MKVGSHYVTNMRVGFYRTLENIVDGTGAYAYVQGTADHLLHIFVVDKKYVDAPPTHPGWTHPFAYKVMTDRQDLGWMMLDLEIDEALTDRGNYLRRNRHVLDGEFTNYYFQEVTCDEDWKKLQNAKM